MARIKIAKSIFRAMHSSLPAPNVTALVLLQQTQRNGRAYFTVDYAVTMTTERDLTEKS